MSEYRFQYRCRRCGAIDDSVSTECDSLLVAVHLERAMRHPDPFIHEPVSSHVVHSCGNGNYGVTDLIGVEKKE